MSDERGAIEEALKDPDVDAMCRCSTCGGRGGFMDYDDESTTSWGWRQCSGCGGAGLVGDPLEALELVKKWREERER